MFLTTENRSLREFTAKDVWKILYLYDAIFSFPEMYDSRKTSCNIWSSCILRVGRAYDSTCILYYKKELFAAAYNTGLPVNPD